MPVDIGHEFMGRNLNDFKIAISVYFYSQLALITIIKDVLFQERIYRVHTCR